jgi:tyrosine-protein kinase Etk/Wzc
VTIIKNPGGETVMPMKDKRVDGYLQQLRKKRRRDNRSSELLFAVENILRNGWLISGVACFVAMCGILYALSVTPIYESNILMQIKRSAPLSGELSADLPTATEVEILRSRALLTRVVNALQLDISIEPKLFPVLGRFIAARNADISTPGLFGRGGYVWGADRVRLASFTAPPELQRRAFTLTVTAKDELMLSEHASGILLKARVASMASCQTKYGPITLLVAEISAHPGAQFMVSQRPEFQVVEQLQRSLAISEKVKQSNVITVSLQGSKPELVSGILNEIGAQYISQQVSQRTAEAKKQLLFYDQQVAESVKRLRELDVKINQILRRFGTSDLSEEERILAQESVALKARLEDREQKKTELSGRFADGHPEITTLTTIIQNIRHDLEEVESKRRMIASAQHEILSANRDKQINSEMNLALVNARHKLDALLLSNNVNIRWVDRAETPTQPTTLGLTVMIPMACLIGMVLGILASMLKNFIVGNANGSRDFDGGRHFTVIADIPDRKNSDKLRKKAAQT